jgi:hypothetical protein
MLRYLYLISAVICIPTLSLLLMSAGEREDMSLTRWLVRRLFPNSDFHLRHKRISHLCGVLFAVFFLVAIVAFVISRFGNKF